ncbi:MAG: efflux RND transporter periplasmic adaptor subunit [Acidobacteriota bacterium]
MGKTYKIAKLSIIFSLLFLFIVFSTSCKKTEQTEKIKSKETSMEHAEHKHSGDKKQAEKKTLYHCPMHPNYISDKPGECPICGMTLVPIEEEEHEKMEMPEGTVRISPEKQQLIGVTFGKAEYRNLEKIIRTVARFTYDETKLTYINTKFPGWIEKLYVDYTGKLVKKGQPLFSIYSPELVSAQEEYLLALKAKGYFEGKVYNEVTSSTDTLLDSARRRLIYWDITEEQIKELEKSRRPLKTMEFYAPFTGFVVEKNILQGKYVMPGENLYRIADISNIWVLADIYEYELPFVSIGQNATVELPYFPGEQFIGKITYIYPYLETETRTVKVRIEFPNKDFKLKPDMYGNINLKLNLGEKLTIPESAVLDSGKRKLIFIDRGEGYFEPREVKLGSKIDDYYEVIEGVKEGEKVVTSANFLIDSESKLKSAIKKPHEH